MDMLLQLCYVYLLMKVEITLKLMFYVAYFLNQVKLGQGTTATGIKSSLNQFAFLIYVQFSVHGLWNYRY